MTTIKATCPTCGEVSLAPEDIELRVDASGGREDFYAFICPECIHVVRKRADERVIRLLQSGGVAALPHEEDELPSPRFPGPRLTHDDILDFHTLLQSEDWFDQLVGLKR